MKNPTKFVAPEVYRRSFGVPYSRLTSRGVAWFWN